MKVAVKTYKITLNSISNIFYHYIVNFSDPFEALAHVLEKTENIRLLIEDFEVKVINGKVKLTEREIKFLIGSWKEQNVKPQKISSKHHPRWLGSNIITTGLHENENYVAWVKLYGDWIMVDKATGELTISDKNKCVAQFEEWPDLLHFPK